MRKSDIDKILYTQLIIARMGEKELMNWWNTDIAFEMGGADFLKRLLGDKIAPVAAGEGILKAAYLKESQLIDEMPDRNSVHSLFCPEPEVYFALEVRMRHFKRYPESMPENISQILNPKKDWTSVEFSDLIQSEKIPEFTGSSFGKEIEYNIVIGMPELMLNLASLIKTNEKGHYVMSYYRN